MADCVDFMTTGMQSLQRCVVNHKATHPNHLNP